MDECENGADKLLAKIKIAFEKENFSECRSIYNEMEKRHPDSKLFNEVKKLYERAFSIEKKREEERIRQAEREKQEKLRALKKLKKEYDDVSGITWYKQPYFTHYTNTYLTSIYLGHENNSVWLRLRMSYEGDDWIFFERAYLSYDSNTMEIFFNEYNDKETDSGYGGRIWEWIDVQVTPELKVFLEGFAESPNAKMRFSGKYTKTRKLTRNERKGISDVLKGYDALKEGLN
ncbi:MAG: hypothetical protein PVH88_18355 [Ignavibacteria bacterium]